MRQARQLQPDWRDGQVRFETTPSLKKTADQYQRWQERWRARRSGRSLTNLRKLPAAQAQE